MSVAIHDATNLANVAKVDSSGNLAVSGSFTATNNSVGVIGATAPTSATEIGYLDNGTGHLFAVGDAHPLPVTGTFTATATNNSVGATGSTTPTSATLIGADKSGNLSALTVDASGYLQVDIKTGAGSGGTAAADESAFTEGTSNVTPIGGEFKTSPTSLTSGQCGVVRLTADRQMMTDVEKFGGNAVVTGTGASGNGIPRVTVSNDSAVLATLQAGTSGGCSTNVQQALTTSAQVKSSAGQLYGFAVYNPNASDIFLMFYNTTSAPTIGSTTNLLFECGITAGLSQPPPIPAGIVFSSGIYVAVSTSATGSAAPGTGIVVTTVYK